MLKKLSQRTCGNHKEVAERTARWDCPNICKWDCRNIYQYYVDYLSEIWYF